MSTFSTDPIKVSLEELYALGAADPLFYCHEFFPKTFRSESPLFHSDYWAKIEDPSLDYFGAEMFRGAGKTTLARAAISRRLAYGISRNVLAVAISEAMAANTVRWVKKQVENNTHWTSVFGLQKGAKWTDDWIEIYHKTLDFTINVIAKGMTSGLRGLNLDDWRPDFIYCDDICNEENTGTEEQRIKTSDLLFGALAPSLAPKMEAPLRKLVLTQTGLHKDDCINMAHRDPSWLTVKYPKIYKDEEHRWHSAWPTLHPVDACLREKESYIQRRQLHIWLREYECKLVSAATSAFDPAWLKYWKVLPTNMAVFIGIDPASDSKRKEAHKSALVAIGVYAGETYLLEYYAQKGKNPEELWTVLTGMRRRWGARVRKIGSESVAFQKMLAWYFRQKMQENNDYFVIAEVNDRRSKPDRIRQAYSGIASNGKLWISENHTEFVQEFTEYADNVDSDLLDAGAQAITLANPHMLVGSGGADIDLVEEDYAVMNESHIPDLGYEGYAP
jgi:hypothetical protein